MAKRYSGRSTRGSVGRGRRSYGGVRRKSGQGRARGARGGYGGRARSGGQQTVRLVIEQVPAAGVPGAIDAATGAMTAPSRLRKARY